MVGGLAASEANGRKLWEENRPEGEVKDSHLKGQE